MTSVPVGMAIPTDTQSNRIFKRAFELLPEDMRHRAVVAGGAVRDIGTAEDIDVFILGVASDYEMDEVRRAIESIPGIDVLSDTAAPAAADAAESEEYMCHDFKVLGTLKSGLLPVQFIACTSAGTVDALLRDFDISTHCLAVTADGNAYRIAETTSITESPKLVTVHDPEHTFKRYRKICLRYDIEPDPAELVKLCKMPVPTNN